MNLSLVNLAMFLMAAVTVAAAPAPRAVEHGADGRLAYAADARGNRAPDFSFAGYAGGDATIPDVPIRVVVPHAPGDQTRRIQSAIDHVASLPVDSSGFRGAVLLGPGRYEISRGLKIAASGVVLRGSGATGDKATILLASGHDRRTLVTVAGKDDRTTSGEPVAIADAYVSVNATTLRLAKPNAVKKGDTVLIRRACTAEWIAALGMNGMGGERHGFSWRPGSREVVWDRTVTSVDGDAMTIDAPLTDAIDPALGGGSVSAYAWPGRLTNVGVEHLRCESTFDRANPKDENHAWFGLTLGDARDAWVRQVTFAHFAGSAVAVWESASRVTVEDCASVAPDSEVGGHRRHTFFTAGQQTLFQRCYSERGRHDFAAGFCAPGPNAFVQCEARDALGDSGAIDSWATGVLFDNVRVDGNAISLHDRRFEAQGAGWAAANSMLWQCSTSLLRCYSPPGATNWAVGCWATFDGNGVWQSSNESVKPTSLYYAQLGDRIGADAARARAQLMAIPSDASSSPTAEQAAALAAASRGPAPEMRKWIEDAAKRTPIATDASGVKNVDELPRVPETLAVSDQRPMSVRNGWIVAGDQLLVGGRRGVPWWRGGVRPYDADKAETAVTRFVPGRSGRGWTDDLDDVAADMRRAGDAVLQHNYGLWYDRRRDDHERVRRMTGDVAAPFYEQPFARSGLGVAWDGLSKYDLTKFNPWYWDRLAGFADVCARDGLILAHSHYFQHNILEAGAHWADSPWRPVNNVNDTGFPEPPPYAGDKRIFLAEPFYDVSHPTRRALHRGYIRKCLDNFADRPNVIHLTSAEYTGPLHFVQFWLDTVAEWERETGRNTVIALAATKDVQDAVLADAGRAGGVDVVWMEYWWDTAEGGTYAPQGGQNLAPRQHMRVWKGPTKRSDAATARQIRAYRKRHPGKAIVAAYDGLDGWSALVAGASVAPVRGAVEPRLLMAIPAMQPYEPTATPLAADQWALAEVGRNYLVCSLGEPKIRLELPPADAPFAVRWIDTASGRVHDGGSVAGGALREFAPPTSGRHVLWLSREG